MIKKLLLSSLLVIIISGNSYAFNPLNIFTQRVDHQLHFLLSYAVTDVMQQRFRMNSGQSYTAIETVGIIKEFMDSRSGGHWDPSDQNVNRFGWLAYNAVNGSYDVFTEKGDSSIHFFASHLLAQHLQSEGWDWWQSYLAVEAVNLLKEYSDSRSGKGLDTRDLNAGRYGWLIFNLFRIDYEW